MHMHSEMSPWFASSYSTAGFKRILCAQILSAQASELPTSARKEAGRPEKELAR
jgi:hypothetical protein